MTVYTIAFNYTLAHAWALDMVYFTLLRDYVQERPKVPDEFFSALNVIDENFTADKKTDKSDRCFPKIVQS